MMASAALVSNHSHIKGLRLVPLPPETDASQVDLDGNVLGCHWFAGQNCLSYKDGLCTSCVTLESLCMRDIWLCLKLGLAAKYETCMVSIEDLFLLSSCHPVSIEMSAGLPSNTMLSGVAGLCAQNMSTN